MREKEIVKNDQPFNEVCDNSFGREVLFTNELEITRENILVDLQKRLNKHNQNATEIDYLYNYYLGNQPVLYRKKVVRPEINNKIVQNFAYFIVETKTADIASEPIQYVLRGTDEKLSQEISDLNALMDSEDKPYLDISIARWRSICGTAYRFISNDNTQSSVLDETDFRLSVPDPRDTFVVYYNNGLPAYSCQRYKNNENKNVYFVYTNTQYFQIISNKIVDEGINGFKAIPVIEYPNNEFRLSDIEITIGLCDAANEMASSRLDNQDQFIQSFIKFINCEIDEEKFKKLKEMGAFMVKSNNGDNKADVDIMSEELNQTQSQVAADDLFNKILIIQGIANREGNTGGDTGQAVNLRNGYIDSEKRAELSEPAFKKAEKQFLRILLYRLAVNQGYDLKVSDVEIKISRSKMDNMLVKAETLEILLRSGIYSEGAIKTVGLFTDPELVALESKDRMDILYPTEENLAPADNLEPKEVIEVEDEV